MKKIIPVILFIISYCMAFAQDTDEYFDELDSIEEKKGLFSNKNAIKLSPAIFTGLVPRGINFYYEKGLGCEHFSINLSIRYYAGSVDKQTGSSQEVFVPEHSRFEIQPRFWPGKQFNGLNLGPIFGVYHTGDITGGFSFGYLAKFSKHFFVEGFAGIQTSAIEEGLTNSIYIRYGLCLGYFWTGKRKVNE